MSEYGTVTVLLVEDNDVDAEAIHRAFRKHKIGNPIVVATDGIEALEILRGTDERDPLPQPYVILLDLNMPRMTGIEFLEEIRDDPDLAESVVFVLTTSEREEDKLAAYDLQVAGYVVKSDVAPDFFKLADMLDHYARVVTLPPPKR